MGGCAVSGFFVLLPRLSCQQLSRFLVYTHAHSRNKLRYSQGWRNCTRACATWFTRSSPGTHMVGLWVWHDTSSTARTQAKPPSPNTARTPKHTRPRLQASSDKVPGTRRVVVSVFLGPGVQSVVGMLWVYRMFGFGVVGAWGLTGLPSQGLAREPSCLRSEGFGV